MLDKVVDASVLIAFAFGEPRAAEARELMAGVALHAPNLLPYELCSAALHKTRMHPQRALAIAGDLNVALAIDVALEAVSSSALLPLALETGLTVYDASYLWIAKTLGCELVTFDQRLARAASVVQA